MGAKMKKVLIFLFTTVMFLTLTAQTHTAVFFNGTQDKYTAECIDLLTEYLTQSTGSKPAINKKGKSKYSVFLEIKAENGDDPETFRLKSGKNGKITISGATSLALRHGVLEFLERCVGVRWLFTGKDGEYIPKCQNYKLSEKDITMTPVYKVRSFSLNNKPNRRWAAKNKGIFHYDYTMFPNRPWFHHNLCSLLSVAKYGKSNPEFFPIQKGKRFIPEKNVNIFWQQCFTAPGIEQAFTNEINRIFNKRKGLKTISFGVNDGGGFCECKNCMALDNNDPSKRTVSYMTFFDKVVRNCYKPGRTFGFLAYGIIRQAPLNGKTYHHALKPFLTYERLYWADQLRAKKDKRETLEWQKTTGSDVGWYDYFAYRSYLIPKISLNITPAAIRWGAKNNVKYYYAEAHPSPDWQEGPMLRILLKLLWNPDEDVNAILNDWCTAAVGKKAGVHLENYYKLCSEYWEKEVPQTDFFKVYEKSGQYLGTGNPGYMVRLTDKMLNAMQYELEQSVKLAEPWGKKRANMYLSGFQSRLPQIKSFLANHKLQQELSAKKFKTVLKEDFNKKRLWTPWQRKPSKGKFYHTPDDGINNSGAMAMDFKNSYRDMVLMRNFKKVVPGRVYRATIKVRNVESLPGAQFVLRIAWATSKKAWLDPAFEQRQMLIEDGSYSWQTLTVSVIAPEIDGVFMKIMVSGNKLKSGKIFFDDFILEEAEK